MRNPGFREELKPGLAFVRKSIAQQCGNLLPALLEAGSDEPFGGLAENEGLGFSDEVQQIGIYVRPRMKTGRGYFMSRCQIVGGL